jgi:cytochrome c oxidase subunit II
MQDTAPAHRNQMSRELPKWLAVPILTLILSACSQAPANRTTPNAMDPKGFGGRIVMGEFWIQFWMGTAVFLTVMAILIYIIYRQRANRRAPDLGIDLHEPEKGMLWVWVGGIIVPVVILSIIFGLSVGSARALATPPEPEQITIEVTGHRWWWEVRYPQLNIVTANEIHVPVGEAVRIELRTNDVIHSFWLPEIMIKTDLIPGQLNAQWILVEEPGVYRGVCAEFCGLQHARMHFMLVAEPRERFEEWVEKASSPAQAVPDDELAQAGQEVFLSTSCFYCHQIRGTSASGSVGPDLTHFASRLTLAAGSMENNIGNLGGWILDPQHIKPGSLMPPTDLTGEELQALLYYLSTLE